MFFQVGNSMNVRVEFGGKIDDVFNNVEYLETRVSKFSTSFLNSKFEYRDGNNYLRMVNFEI